MLDFGEYSKSWRLACVVHHGGIGPTMTSDTADSKQSTRLQTQHIQTSWPSLCLACYLSGHAVRHHAVHHVSQALFDSSTLAGIAEYAENRGRHPPTKGAPQDQLGRPFWPGAPGGAAGTGSAAAAAAAPGFSQGAPVTTPGVVKTKAGRRGAVGPLLNRLRAEAASADGSAQ